jgi:putative DNA primase/helicase
MMEDQNMPKMRVNCKFCLSDKHDECNREDCLCAVETYHNTKGKMGWSEDEPTQQDVDDYNAVTNNIPEPTLEKLKEALRIKHDDSDRIDKVASYLIKKYNFATVRETDVIYYYNGKIYDSKNAISIIKEETEKQIKECTRADKLEVIDKIKSLTYKEIAAFDSDPNLITVENGIYNISTMELTPHTPTNLSKVLIPCSFIENVLGISETKFWKYLISTCTVNGKLDEDMSDDILELMASCFVKNKVDEKSFILLGNGDNGKSVLLLLLNSMLGKDNVSNIALQDLVSNPFAAARLDGKLANIYTDLKSTALKNEEKIKNLSSGEPMHVEHKYQDGFDMVTYAKLIFSCNQFPKVYDQSDGFFRRWIIIQFRRKFALGDPDRDEKLKEKLINNQDEKNLIFSYLMIMSEKLLRTGKFRYPLGHAEIRKLWNANADPLYHFIENCIIETEDSKKTKRETYKFYEQWCYDHGVVPLGKGQFGKAFGEEFDEDRVGSKRYWIDIDFKVPKQESFDDRRQW